MHQEREDMYGNQARDVKFLEKFEAQKTFFGKKKLEIFLEFFFWEKMKKMLY